MKTDSSVLKTLTKANSKGLQIDLPFQPSEFPSIRIETAIKNKADKDLCFVVGGGLGDRACAEPTLRFAIETFKDVSISLICETPELFRHLKFKEIFDLKKSFPIVGRHLYLNTYPNSLLFNQFVNANMVNLVDYASLSTLRCQLPPERRQLKLDPPAPGPSRRDLYDLRNDRYVLIHAGKSWPSRTFPVSWWNEVIRAVTKANFHPVLIGSNTVEGEPRKDDLPLSGFERLGGYEQVIDLRGKTNLLEFLWVCKQAHHLITNDSSPLHLAAAGRAKIAYIATCRRGDLLFHQREGGWGWRMKDFAKSQMNELYGIIPNHIDPQHISSTPPGTTVDQFLPDPQEIVQWLIQSK